MSSLGHLGDFIMLSIHIFIMRMIMFLPIVLVLISGCVQEQPTGKFLVNQIDGETCVSSWSCSDWSDCVRVNSYSGLQSRTCTDSKGMPASERKAR
jgi:hypothetical protein